MKASEKIHQTAVAMRSPQDGADGPELALSTLVQGLTTPTARGWIEAAQEQGELDEFMEVLARWIIAHRSDDASLLAIVELPRGRDLPAGTILHRVDEAKAVALGPPPDLTPAAA
jgi:hypothetical protein